MVETIMLDLAHKHFARYTEGMLPATVRWATSSYTLMPLCPMCFR